MRKKIRDTKVSEVRHLIAGQPDLVARTDSIDRVIDKLLENPITRSVFVVDSHGVLIGVIRLNSLLEYVFPFETLWLHDDYKRHLEVFYMEKAEDIMSRDFRFVHDTTTLNEVATLMSDVGVNELPVVDAQQRVVGEVNFLEILEYLRGLARV